MSPTPSKTGFRFRAVFVSDVHLGYRGCSADYLLDFLRSIETETLYLVGDIIDLWSMKKSFFWPQSHSEVLRVIFDKARSGTRVVYIPGNHDSVFRDYEGQTFGNVEIVREALHETADGRKLVVLHGDEFDSAIKASPLIVALGERVYSFILGVNRLVNFLRRRCGFPYWSVAAYLKQKSRKATTYIENFEQTLAAEARRRGVDGMICGHIHRAGIRRIGDVLYCNDGDWVESCTTLTEDFSGRLSLLRWTERKEVVSHSALVANRPIDQAA